MTDSEAALDARIDAIHGVGAVAAIEAAVADGSIFSDGGWQPGDPVALETDQVRVCPTCGCSWDATGPLTCPACDT